MIPIDSFIIVIIVLGPSNKDIFNLKELWR